MNKIGVWNQGNVLQHPSGHGDVKKNDVCFDLLYRKLCPMHLTPLILRNVYKLGEDYIREQYGCMTCRCRADFVGDELKTDSVGRTLEFINLWIKERREMKVAKIKPTAKSGVEV